VGRAIVRKPKAFLFDEPLSNLDAKMRVQMRTEISKLHLRLQSTMIYVTHDQVEAMTMGDRIVVMKDGLIQQVAPPIELYDEPVNLFVAGFIGSPPMNFFTGTLVRQNGSLAFNEGTFTVTVESSQAGPLGNYAGKEVVFGIRPEDIRGAETAADTAHQLNANVEVVEPMGAEIFLYLSTGNHSFTARVDAHNTAKENQKLTLYVNMAKSHFFDKESTQCIV
jgi:multiple sugar transport system ATP-binding protein